jgi:hypothetical protein
MSEQEKEVTRESENFYLGDHSILSKVGIVEWHSFCCGEDNARLLELAIEKWTFLRSVVKELGVPIVDGGVRTCPLCQKYYENDCDGCPIYLATEEFYCEGTGYDDYSGWMLMPWENMDPELLTIGLKYIDEEIAFLRSLMQEEEENA